MNKAEERELVALLEKYVPEQLQAGLRPHPWSLGRTAPPMREGILVGRYYEMVWRIEPDGRLVRLTRDGCVIEAR